MISAWGEGLVTMLCNRIRASRYRSRTLVEPGIIDSHNSPSMIKGSTPLIRAELSRRVVPISTTPGPISSSCAIAASVDWQAANSDHRISCAYPTVLTADAYLDAGVRLRSWSRQVD